MELEGHRKEISMKTVRQATKKWEPTYSKYAAKKAVECGGLKEMMSKISKNKGRVERLITGVYA